jgi:hypothetical protein
MISSRSKPARAGIASVLTLLMLCAAVLVLPAAATAAPPEGGSPPQLAFEPESHDFGLQRVYESGQATLQLRNTGDVTAPVYSLDIVGPGSGAFWIDGGGTDCYGRNLQPDEACSVRAGFNPYDASHFAAQLRAGSEEGTAFTADLSGEGGRAFLAAEVDPTNFGAVAVGSTGVTKAIEVSNSGNYPGAAFIAVIAGGAIGSFHLLDENCTGILLGPGADCTLLVNFRPLSSGVKTARLGLFGDQENGAQVMLTGIGVEADAPSSAKASTASAAAPEAGQKRRGKHRRHKVQRNRLRAAVSAYRPSR